MKSKNVSVQEKENRKRKVTTYVVVGIITFTMIFSVFASLVYSLKY